jgi:tRNA(Ile)-lysidine synthase
VSRRAPRDPDAPLGEAELAAAFAGLGRANGVLVAVSGGPDSTALLGALAEWARASDPPQQLYAATVDHGLRADARNEAEQVATFSRSLGLPHAILTWSGAKGSGVSQEASRRARYRLLLAHAREIGATHLVTAHTLDDQAETLLMRLAAGSGLSGLAGMRREVDRQSVRHIRPFLHLPKARLVATCRLHGWGYVEDPSNRDPRFARVRWRDSVMPILAAEGLHAERLGRLAGRLARADEALDRVSEAVFARAANAQAEVVILDLALLATQPLEIALRVLRRALNLAGSPTTAGEDGHLRLERLEECLDGLLSAHGRGRAARRTLAGFLLGLDGKGRLTIAPEGVRRRGKRDPVTPIGVSDPPSLGSEPGRA